MPVGQYPRGATPDTGVLDLAGNVWEWTSSLWGKSVEKPDFGYPYNPKDGRENQDAPNEVLRVLRGGAWFTGQKGVRCAYRSGAPLATGSAPTVSVSPGVLSRSALFAVLCPLFAGGSGGCECTPQTRPRDRHFASAGHV